MEILWPLYPIPPPPQPSQQKRERRTQERVCTCAVVHQEGNREKGRSLGKHCKDLRTHVATRVAMSESVLLTEAHPLREDLIGIESIPVFIM